MGRLIDADRLKDILEYGMLCNVPNDAVNTEEEKLNDWVQEVVDKAPTVETIPVIHAYWIKRFYNCYECSNCHNLINMLERKTNYCKDCGAKMDLENENGKID